MPRFKDDRTWELIRDVPAVYFRLVKEALSLRQKIVVARQSIHFLQRCLQHRVVPSFIRSRKLYEVCGQPKDSRKVLELEMEILRMSIRNKKDQMFAQLKKCAAKEQHCARYLETSLWRRIVSGSKTICDCIRPNAKSVSQRKFETLLCKSQNCFSHHHESTSVHHRDDDDATTVEKSVPELSRVTVVGGFALPPHAREVLELGPSFSPSQPFSSSVFRKIAGSLQALQDRLRCKAKLDHVKIPTRENAGSLPIPPFPRTFYRRHGPCDSVDSRFRLFATDLFSTLNRFSEMRHRSNLSAAQKCGMREIRSLIKSQSIRLSISDKGGEFVVIPKELDEAITEQHLRDETLYRPSSPQEFLSQSRRLNKVWVNIAKAANLRLTFISRLKVGLPVCPVLYLLIKTHKLSADDLASTDPSVYKVRPIISCVDGPSDRISWFLNLILVQLLNYVPAHLKNTNMFLDHLRNALFDDTCVMESFDVNSLYTNVSNDSAMQAVFELLTEHQENIQLHGLSIAHVMALVKECLSCTVFRWSGNYFAQTRGLAMGQRLAPVLAIAFMAKIESPILESRPLLYCRYIDDCFVICSTQNEMDRFFEMMNQQSEHIKLTRETPTQDWLPFLNVQIHISAGNLRTKWYRKPSNKNIIVHCSSAHPARTKRAIIGSMFKTAARVCSGSEEKHESLGLATTIAKSNGYVPGRPHSWRRSNQTRKGHANVQDKVQFCMPFISDEVSRATRLCLRRADLEDLVTIVEIPPKNLKDQLGRNRIYDRLCTTPNCIICPFGREGDCMKSCVVYMIKCRNCGDEYIGETARPLCVRVKEHLEGKSSSRSSTPLGCHRMRVHNGVDYEVETTILELETEISARKTLEAFWIHVKNPKMNRKEECPTVTNELLPYLRLCNI